MKEYEVEIESRIYVKVKAEDEEDAKINAMENPEFGDMLLQNASVSDVGDGIVLKDEVENE